MAEEAKKKPPMFDFLGLSRTACDRVMDREFLYCPTCGERRTVSKSGDVAECSNCMHAAFNLFEESK